MMPRQTYRYPALQSLSAAIERRDITQTVVEVVDLPDYPQIKHGVRRRWEKDGTITIEQCMVTECAKCLAKNEFAVALDVAPAVMTSRLDIHESVQGLFELLEASRNRNYQMERYLRQLTEQTTWSPKEGFAEMMDAMLEGADE